VAAQAAATRSVAGVLLPPMHSACLSAGHAVSQPAQAPLAGASLQALAPPCAPASGPSTAHSAGLSPNPSLFERPRTETTGLAAYDRHRKGGV
jgi:hypothetical protein